MEDDDAMPKPLVWLVLVPALRLPPTLAAPLRTSALLMLPRSAPATRGFGTT